MKISNDNPCERIDTKSRMHTVSAHRDRVCVSAEAHGDGENYSLSQLWMPVAEARDLVRVLQEAIALTVEYQEMLKPTTEPKEG
jgi:hypothetical protein